MIYPEDQYRMISELQHFIFCRRQWALIHLEQEWDENRLTAEGEVIHKNAHDEDFREKRTDTLIVRGLRVASRELGVTGQCDVVEFVRCAEGEDGAVLHGHRGIWKVVPVEYKHGSEKYDECDTAQLCCQAMCLEEMLACRIPAGFLYYHKTRRRVDIEFTDDLRKLVKNTLLQIHQYASRGLVPHVKPGKFCKSCSLSSVCLPELQEKESVKEYYEAQLREEEP